MPMLAFALLASQTAGMSSAPRPAEARPGRAALQECVAVQAVLTGGRRLPSRLPAFSARDTAEIQLNAQAQRPWGGRALELRIFLPDGHLYQTIGIRDPAAPVRPASPRPGPTAWVGPRTATVRFPVAGTAIATSSLYGTWSVVPYLDGLPAACGASRFAIRP